MIKDKNIVIFSSIDWDFIWQGHQEIAYQLSQNGNRVLFVENTGVRAPNIKDISRIKNRIKNWFKSIKGFRKISHNLYVFSPIILPFPYSNIAIFINKLLLKGLLLRWFRIMKFEDPIIITFIPTKLINSLLDSINRKILVYYCIDSFENSSKGARKIIESEKVTFKKSDIVFVTSYKLYDKAKQYNNEVHIVPFGVSLRNFQNIDNKLYPDIANIKKPIVGYVGGIHKWMDFELLRKMALTLPDVSFVFIGPVQTDISLIEELDNIYLLGKKDHRQLSSYISAFDICIIPYKIADYTSNVYPTKLNEYLFLEKKVVSTKLFEVEKFNEKHGCVIDIAEDIDDFIDKVKYNIENEISDSEKKRFRNIALENTWENKIKFMSNKINEKINYIEQNIDKNWAVFFKKGYKSIYNFVKVAVVIFILLYFFIFYTPIMWWFAAPLKKPNFFIEKVDALAVLAGGVGESGRVGQGYEERVSKAVDLYKNGISKYIIMSSGSKYYFQEVEVMKILAISMGVPDSCILLDSLSRSTYNNVCNVYNIAKQKKFDSIGFVTTKYHTRRLYLTSKSVFKDKKFFIYPLEVTQFYKKPDSYFLFLKKQIEFKQVKAILHEYIAILYYYYKGYIKW